MKLLVIGLGSMGKRRIRLLKEYDSDIEIIGIDKQAIRRDEVEKLYKIKKELIEGKIDLKKKFYKKDKS